MSLSETVLDALIKRFDSDSDGMISFREFEAMMHKLHGSFWTGFSKGIKQGFFQTAVTRKLDVAFRLSDIDRVESIYDFEGSVMMLAGSEMSALSLAIHLKEVIDPLVILCSKPGHVEAWVEAFRVCMSQNQR